MSYKNTVYERLHSNIKFINTKKSHPVWQSQQCRCTRPIQKLTSIEYYKASNNFLSEKNVTLTTDSEAPRTTFVRTRPTLQLHNNDCHNLSTLLWI